RRSGPGVYFLKWRGAPPPTPDHACIHRPSPLRATRLGSGVSRPHPHAQITPAPGTALAAPTSRPFELLPHRAKTPTVLRGRESDLPPKEPSEEGGVFIANIVGDTLHRIVTAFELPLRLLEP